jgi:hypothetical protein
LSLTESHHERKKIKYMSIEERRAYSRAYYAAHKEQCKGYHKKWAAKHNQDWKESHPNYKRDWTRKQMFDPEYKAKRRKYSSTYENQHRAQKPKKPLAKERVNARNQSKKIPVKECEFCGETKRLVRHHPDYDYPKIIVVCCYSCHKYVHLDLKAIEVIS